MEGTEIVLDYRERALRALMPGAASAPLPVGDVLVRSGGVPRLLLERKTVADLAASIRDGRWREQTERLAGARASPEGARLAAGVVVEGPEGEGAGGVSAEGLSNALLSASARRGLLVMRARDAEGTARLIERAAASLAREAGRPGGPTDAEALASSAPRFPGSPRATTGRCGPRAAGAAMLAVVPGVSPALAEALMGGRGSLAELVAELAPMDRAGRIAALSSAARPGSGRRAGPAVAASVAGALFGDG